MDTSLWCFSPWDENIYSKRHKVSDATTEVKIEQEDCCVNGGFLANIKNQLQEIMETSSFQEKQTSIIFQSTSLKYCSIDDFIVKLVHLSTENMYPVAMATILLKRLSATTRIDLIVLEKILLGLTIVATKFCEDDTYDNYQNASQFGFTLTEINEIEVQTCFALEWNAAINSEEEILAHSLICGSVFC